MQVLDIGGGDGKRARELYPDAEITVLDKIHGWDVMTLGVPKGDWDVILLNHFIEHVHDPDFVLDECYKNMTQKTILDIGIPNLSAWFNRILFLFGYLPHSYELSYRINVGKIHEWNFEPLGGHIRVPNVPAMLQLLKFHYFKIISVRGEPSFYPCHFMIRAFDRILTDLNPNLASSARILCRI